MSLYTPVTAITTAGTKQFANPPVFKAYQVKDNLIPYKLYWDDSSAYPLTDIATGTHATVSSRRPLAGDLYETLFDPANTSSDVPLVGQKRDYARITAGAIDDGAKISVGNWDLSNRNWFVLVVKSTGTSIAGKLKIRSSAGNESVCSFTTNSTADTWEAKVFDFRTDGATNVAFTGTPVFTGITEIEVTVDTADSVDVAMTYATVTRQEIIGSELTIVHPCISEAGIEDSVDVGDLLCRQLAEASTVTGRTTTVTLGTKKKDIADQAIALGDVLSKEQVYVPELYYDATLNSTAIATGTITVTAGLKIAHIYIDGVGYLQAFDSATDVPEGAYHYSGTTITVNAIYNGKVPRIYIYNQKNLLVRKARGLELGYVGYLDIPRKTENGSYEYWKSSKAQVRMTAESFNDDFDQINFEYKLFANASGAFYTVANE